MSIELLLGSANLVALLGYFIRTENRLTRMETQIGFLINQQGKEKP